MDTWRYQVNKFILALCLLALSITSFAMDERYSRVEKGLFEHLSVQCQKISDSVPGGRPAKFNCTSRVMTFLDRAGEGSVKGSISGITYDGSSSCVIFLNELFDSGLEFFEGKAKTLVAIQDVPTPVPSCTGKKKIVLSKMAVAVQLKLKKVINGKCMSEKSRTIIAKKHVDVLTMPMRGWLTCPNISSGL